MSQSNQPYLEISFRPTIATINEARRLVANVFGPVVNDPDVAARIALATHELLENGLKYSLDGSTMICVEVSHERVPRTVSIVTKNRVSPEHRAGLEEAFSEMRQFGHAHEYYQFTMKRTRLSRHGSGLGLARIWSEAEMDLSFSCEGEEARVTASLSIEVSK